MTEQVEAEPELSPALPKERAALMALAQVCTDGPRWSETAWSALLDTSEDYRKRVVLVLRAQSGMLLGFIAGSCLAEEAELEFVLLVPEARGRGYGRRLLEAWLAWAAAQGCTAAYLEARVSNKAAHALYRAARFQEEGLRRDYYREPLEDARCMRLRLAAEGFNTARAAAV